MTFTITLNGVLIFLGSAAGIVLLVYLIMTAIKLNRILKDVKDIVDKNKSNVDSIMISLPKISSNIEGITGELNDGVQSIASTVGTIEKSMVRTTKAMEEKTENIVDYVYVVTDIVKAIVGMFQKKKTNKR